MNIYLCSYIYVEWGIGNNGTKRSRQQKANRDFSTVAQSKIHRLVNRYCNDLDIKLVFTKFKLRNIFSVEDSVARELRSRAICKFTCASCNAWFIGETGHHFSTCVREHLRSDKSSYRLKTPTKLRTLSSILLCGLFRNPWFHLY